jgi:hypothetical protein
MLDWRLPYLSADFQLIIADSIGNPKINAAIANRACGNG